jgi:arylsulfatase A-like enzyme
VAAPAIGSIVARTLGPRHADVPAFVDIGQRLEGPMITTEMALAHSPGFLGSAYGPFAIPDPATAAAAVRPPAGMSRERFEERFRRLEAIQKKRAAAQDRPQERDELQEAVDGARRLLHSPAAVALDLAREPKPAAAPYGTSRFGLGCLLARRLIESGVRFVEVAYEYEQFKNWDTHEDGHRRYTAMKQEIDGPLSQLIRDLDERTLLSRTLVVVASEFGRSMLIEGISEDPDAERKAYLERTSAPIPDVLTQEKNYGLHRHFTGSGSVVLFGGGIRGGIRYGATSDEPPFNVADKPVSMANLHATIYRALGIPADLSYEIEGRPFFVTPDGKGKPVLELFQ